MKLELRTSKCIKGTNKGKWGLIVYYRGKSISAVPPIFKDEAAAIEAGKQLEITVESHLDKA